MADFTFGDMLGKAAEAPDTGSTNRDIVVPDGTYDATVVVTNSGKSSTGKHSIGLKFRVDTEGPAKDGGVWGNQYLSPDSAAALEIWFKTFEALGVPRTHWMQFGSDLERACADVATRCKGAKAQIKVEADGNYGPKVRFINPPRTGGASAGPSVAAPQSAPAASRPATPF